jgi:hypothetical protein
MMRILTTTIILLTLLSCCKHDVESPRRNFILAGKNGEGMVYKVFNPNIIVSNVSQNKDTSINVDMNNDGKVDFVVFSYKKILVQSDSTNQIEFCSYQDQSGWNYSPSVSYYAGYLTKFEFTDTIKQSKYWTLSKYWTFKGMLLNTYDLNFTEDWNSGVDEYFGIRFIEKKDTLYGWVRVLKSQSGLVIYDCAYQTQK